MKDYLEYIEESTNNGEDQDKVIKTAGGFVLSGNLGVQYYGVMAFFRGKYYGSTGRWNPMDYAPGRHDRSVSFDREKQLLGKAQVAGADWFWPYAHAFRLCELWHERKHEL